MTEESPNNIPPVDSKPPSGNNKSLIWIMLIALVLLLGAAGYFVFQNQQLQEFNVARETELKLTLFKLDSVNKELAVRIEEVEKLGGDIADLVQIQEEIEEEKRQILTSKNKQLSEVRDRVEGYRELLLLKDEEIAKLREVNESLLTQNITLKEEKNDLNRSISNLNETQQELEKKVEVASKLQAENIRIRAVSRNGKEREGSFKNRQIDKLIIAFNLVKNAVAPIGGKEILIRIVDPNGNVLFDVATGSGTFILNNKEEFYTAKQDILFDNTGQGLSFEYDKGSDYPLGQHRLNVYADGLEIGWADFTVK